MSKPVYTLFILAGLCLPALAETPAETIAKLQKEVAALKIAVGESKNEIIIPKQTDIEAQVSYDAAVQRIQDANDVARQWRSRAVNLQRELNYTKALLTAQGVPDQGPSEDSIILPKFRVDGVSERADVAIVNDVAVHPTYVATR